MIYLHKLYLPVCLSVVVFHQPAWYRSGEVPQVVYFFDQSRDSGLFSGYESKSCVPW